MAWRTFVVFLWLLLCASHSACLKNEKEEAARWTPLPDKEDRRITFLEGGWDPNEKFDIAVIEAHPFFDNITKNEGVFPVSPYSIDHYPAGSAAPPILAHQSITVGLQPSDADLIDANGDGIADFAVSNQGSNTVSIILGLTPTSFSEAANFSVGTAPVMIRHGDFNDDGNLDLVTANEGKPDEEGGLSVLLGLGDGSFQPSISIETGNSVAVEAGDLDDDGDDDLIFALSSQDAVSAMMSNGDGTFAEPRHLSTDRRCSSLSLGDFNSDGNLDIGAGLLSSLAVLMGGGAGDFLVTQTFSFPSGGVTFQTKTGDLDGDGDLDLVTTNADNSVAVLLNRGDGSFDDPDFYVVNNRPENLSVLDLNVEDRHLDLFVGNLNSDHSTLLFNNGDGTFRVGRGYAAPALFDFQNGANALKVADFDQDGQLDIVVSSGRNTVLFRGATGAQFQAAQGLGRRSGFLTAGDFDQDNAIDLALVRRQDEDGIVRPGVLILLGNGDGSFEDGQNIRFQGFSFQEGPVASDRIDEDNFLDLMILDRAANEIKFLAGIGDGTFQAPLSIPVGTQPVQFSLGDLNGDSRLDAVVANEGVLGQDNGSLMVLLGEGDGSFQAPVEVIGSATVQHVALGDFDSDGRLDLLVNTAASFKFAVSALLGNGDGSFQDPIDLPPPSSSAFNDVPVQIADIDLDGDGDAFIAGKDLELNVYLSNGDGTFRKPPDLDFVDIGPVARDLFVGDLDLDRKPDIALASGSLVVSLLNPIGLSAASSRLVARAGGVANTSTRAEGGTPTAGYATVSQIVGPAPSSTAVLSLSQNGIEVSEAGIAGFAPTLRALVPIDQRVGVAPAGAGALSFDTGVAMVNLGAQPARINYCLRDRGGQVLVNGRGTLDPGHHVSRFIGQLSEISDFELPTNFSTDIQYGTLEIESDQPLSVTALRLTTNQRGEALITTLPVADLKQPVSEDPIYLPQFVNGGGANTFLILANPTDQSQEGTFEIFDDEGTPITVTGPTGEASALSYSIPARGLFLFQPDGSSPNAGVGWARVTPSAGSTSPIGAAILQISLNGILVTESGVPGAQLTTRARIFLDTTTGHDTGLAIANPNQASLTVTFRAFQADGAFPVGMDVPSVIPGNGHRARFAGQLISAVPAGFTGVMEISAEQPFAALTLRTLTNQRGDFLITAFPIADPNDSPAGPVVFPQIADGGGIFTQVITVAPGNTSAVSVTYFGDNGRPLAIAGQEPQ